MNQNQIEADQKDGYGFLVELGGETVKFKKTDLTDEFALKILTTNPICKKIEEDFDLFESTNEADDSSSEEEGVSNFKYNLNPGEVLDPDTGEIIQTEHAPDGEE